MGALTSKQQKWRRAAYINPSGFVESRLRIPDLMGREVPFHLNWAQHNASEFLKILRRQNLPIRAWLGKWRRAGITSWRSAEGYAHLYGTDNARVGVIAHLEERAKEILANYKSFDLILERRHPELMLSKSKDNIFGIKFEQTNAQALIATAKNPIKVRGDGLHWLDGSEAAHWFNQFNVVMKEVCPVVPPLPGSQIILESTGSLVGSEPHIHWQESGILLPDGTVKRGENEFVKLFLSWRDDPTQGIPLPNDKARDELYELINYHEPRLAEMNAHYRLTPQQIARSWEMYHLQSKNDFEYFCREFPYDEQMMWAASGRSYFGPYEVSKAKPENPELIVVIDQPLINRVFTDPSELRRVDSVKHYELLPYIKFWRAPRPGRRYVMGSDGAQGVPGGDMSAGYMRDAITRELMCTFHGLLRPDESAHIQVSLARIYNNALLAPECNPAGGGTESMNVMQRLGYHHIYQWRARDRQEGHTLSHSLGWWTQYRTKPLMMGNMRSIFHDCVRGKMQDTGIWRDDTLLNEMRTFVHDPQSGELGGSNGCFDDCVISDAITHQVISDQIYCTKDDPMRQQANAVFNPTPSEALIVKPISPQATIARMMGTDITRKNFEINNEYKY